MCGEFVQFAESSHADEASIGWLQSPSSELCEAFARSLKTGWIKCNLREVIEVHVSRNHFCFVKIFTLTYYGLCRLNELN